MYIQRIYVKKVISRVLVQGNDPAPVIRSIRKKYSLLELVARITKKNRHRSVDWGRPMGKEI